MFIPTIPQATDIIAQSQPQILENNRVVGTLLGPNDGTIQFTAQAPAGNLPVLGAGTVGLFSSLMNEAGGSNVVEIWINDSNANQYPITAWNNVVDGGTNLSTGYMYTPAGFIEKWGWILFTGIPQTIIFDIATQGPAFTTQIINIQATCQTNAGLGPIGVNYGLPNNPAQFSITGPVGVRGIYRALGY